MELPRDVNPITFVHSTPSLEFKGANVALERENREDRYTVIQCYIKNGLSVISGARRT